MLLDLVYAPVALRHKHLFIRNAIANVELGADGTRASTEGLAQANLVCRLLLEKKKKNSEKNRSN